MAKEHDGDHEGETDPGQMKRQRRKEARPGEILSAGLAEFAEKGYAAARLEDIARRAGIAKPTIYLYYSSKEALFEAAIADRLVMTIEGFAEMAKDPGGSVEDLLRGFLTNVYERLVGTDAIVLIRILLAEGHHFPQLVHFYRQAVISRGMGTLQAIVKHGIRTGEIRPGPASENPMLIIAPAMAAAISTLLFPGQSPIDRARFLEGHLDLLKHGLLTSSSSNQEKAPGQEASVID